GRGHAEERVTRSDLGDGLVRENDPCRLGEDGRFHRAVTLAPDVPSRNRCAGRGAGSTTPSCMDLGLAGAAAVVTGGSKGIGRAAALCLAEDGARVCIMARGRAALDE